MLHDLVDGGGCERQSLHAESDVQPVSNVIDAFLFGELDQRGPVGDPLFQLAKGV